MKLIVEPDAGLTPILRAIDHAQKSIDVLIFRLDRDKVTRALAAAVARGVAVRAMLSYANRGDQESLRAVEQLLLDSGVNVSHAADNLLRYHGKMMVVDGQLLHVYGFNFTRLDVHKSRSFGVITRRPGLVHEAMKLFEADACRRPYVSSHHALIVSPENARKRLTDFIAGARHRLLIYDPRLTDNAMITLLQERAAAGVEIRILGKIEADWKLKAQKFPGRRLHVRAILRDGRWAFVGSQSLRRLELDGRREVGLLVGDPRVVRRMHAVFEHDWALTPAARAAATETATA